MSASEPTSTVGGAREAAETLTEPKTGEPGSPEWELDCATQDLRLAHLRYERLKRECNEAYEAMMRASRDFDAARDAARRS